MFVGEDSHPTPSNLNPCYLTWAGPDQRGTVAPHPNVEAGSPGGRGWVVGFKKNWRVTLHSPKLTWKPI